MKSSENGSSFINTQGYPNFLLNLSSTSLTLDTAPSTSEFLANINNVAFALSCNVVDAGSGDIADAEVPASTAVTDVSSESKS